MLLDSNFLHDTNWLMKSFEEGYREQTVLLVADNVLEPHVLQKVNNSITIALSIKHVLHKSLFNLFVAIVNQ